MPSAIAATAETEYDRVRRQIINQILYLDQGLVRGLNHDLRHIGEDEDNLIRYFLKKDKYYQLMERRAKFRRCVDSAEEAMHRRCVIENVIIDLCDDGDLYFLSGIWSLKVSATDTHRKAGRHRRKNPVAFNDSSYHGRPRRDRNRQLSHVAA